MPTHISGKPVYVENVRFLEHFDPYASVFDWGPSGLETAAGIMDSEAVSHRGVHVGSVVTNFDEANKIIIGYGGANYKPTAQDDKECAELTAQATAMKRRRKVARSAGALVPILFDVVSSATPHEIESIIGTDLPTLPPCDKCRDSLIPENAVMLTQSVLKDRSKRSPANTVLEVHTGLEVIAIGDPVRFPVKTRSADVEKIYPRRVLKAPTEEKFKVAKMLYLQRMARRYAETPEKGNPMLRAQMVVMALVDVMGISGR